LLCHTFLAMLELGAIVVRVCMFNYAGFDPLKCGIDITQ